MKHLEVTSNTETGTKVIYNGTYDLLEVKHCEKHLNLNSEYTLDHIITNAWEDEIILKEVPNIAFNATAFSRLPPITVSEEEFIKLYCEVAYFSPKLEVTAKSLYKKLIESSK